jgi:pyruvate/2-oxoglutarate dehydrogenase complex dihydrolipoamide acyltransferase (E2) component
MQDGNAPTELKISSAPALPATSTVETTIAETDEKSAPVQQTATETAMPETKRNPKKKQTNKFFVADHPDIKSLWDTCGLSNRIVDTDARALIAQQSTNILRETGHHGSITEKQVRSYLSSKLHQQKQASKRPRDKDNKLVTHLSTLLPMFFTI